MSKGKKYNIRCKVCKEGHFKEDVKHRICVECKKKIDNHEINLREIYERDRIIKEFGY